MSKILKFISENFLPTKTPQFWEKDNGIGNMLLPFSVLYFLLKRLFSFRKKTPKKFNAKIICVGNITVGGSGKTPTAIALHDFIKLNFPSYRPVFITTGFKSGLSGPVTVDIKKHTAKDVGDEAFMLANYGNTIMAKDRLEGCNFAEAESYNILILDDGLHDERIHKDISLCVIDGGFGLGNGMLIPSGPLRDRPDFAMKEVSDLLIIGDYHEKLVKKIERKARKKFDVSEAEINLVSEHDKSNIYVAFAGIGRPGKFFTSLKDYGLVLAETIGFPDHHKYMEDDYSYLKTLAETQKAKLITTEKDYIKLSPEMQKITECVKIRLRFKEGGHILGQIINHK